MSNGLAHVVCAPLKRSALMVANIERALGLYQGLLGLQTVSSNSVAADIGNFFALLGVKPVPVRYHLLRSGDSSYGWIGLFELDPGVVGTVPGDGLGLRVGEAALVLEVSNVDRLHRQLADAAYAIICPPLMLQIPGKARQREMSFRDRDGIFVNLIERPSLENRPMPDPLLQRQGPDAMPPALRAAWQMSMALRGDATLFEIFANHPRLYDWYTGSFYGGVFNGGLVARRYKELIRLKLSMTHGCRFCNQGNRRDALAAGLTQAQIDALEDYESGPFSTAEKAVLRLADQIALTNAHGTLTPPIYRALRAHFDDAEILEMGLVAGMLAGVAKFLFAFDLVEREESCPFHPQQGEALS